MKFSQICKTSLFVIVLATAFFATTLSQRTYAQVPNDMNKNPTIVMDKHTIEADRRILKSAQDSKNPIRIKLARQKLKGDIRKFKADKAALKNNIKNKDKSNRKNFK
jgi:hypothetical protein